MATKATITCNDCNTTLLLPDDPEDLAFAMTDFIDTHNAGQHYSFALAPPGGYLPDETAAN